MVLGAILVLAENAAALCVQHALSDQVINPGAGSERRVQLDQRLGPEQTSVDGIIHPRANARVADLEETADIGVIVLNQAGAQVKDVHRRLHRRYVNEIALSIPCGGQ